MDEQNDSGQRPRYIWPRFLLGAVALGVVLAVIWMSVLVRRIREERETNPWPPSSQSAPSQTNSPTAKTNGATPQPERLN